MKRKVKIALIIMILLIHIGGIYFAIKLDDTLGELKLLISFITSIVALMLDWRLCNHSEKKVLN